MLKSGTAKLQIKIDNSKARADFEMERNVWYSLRNSDKKKEAMLSIEKCCIGNFSVYLNTSTLHTDSGKSYK